MFLVLSQVTRGKQGCVFKHREGTEPVTEYTEERALVRSHTLRFNFPLSKPFRRAVLNAAAVTYILNLTAGSTSGRRGENFIFG